MWSVGIILYLMLGGYPPFDGDTEEEIFKSIKKQSYSFEEDIWTGVSDQAKGLISKLLVSENDRLSPKEALKHPWFSIVKEEPEKTNSEISSNHIKKLKKFQDLKNFK